MLCIPIRYNVRDKTSFHVPWNSHDYINLRFFERFSHGHFIYIIF